MRVEKIYYKDQLERVSAISATNKNKFYSYNHHAVTLVTVLPDFAAEQYSEFSPEPLTQDMNKYTQRTSSLHSAPDTCSYRERLRTNNAINRNDFIKNKVSDEIINGINPKKSQCTHVYRLATSLIIRVSSFFY